MKGVKWFVLVLMLIIVLGLTGCGETKQVSQTPKPPEPEVQTWELPKPVENANYVSSIDQVQACDSCHDKTDTEDNSLNGLVKKLPRHMPTEATTLVECMACHKSESIGFKTILHKKHYQGDANVFVTDYNGGCIHCHKLTPSGHFVIPGLTEQQAESLEIKVAQVDVSPAGCANCHLETATKDYSLKAIFKDNPKHPRIQFNDVNKCFTCHRGDLALNRFLHPAHLLNEMYAGYGNSCLNCHQQSEDGKVSVKGKNR